MAVPKRRTSKSKRDSRRSQWSKLSPPTLATCPQCREAKLPHHVCPHCGHYAGRQVIATG